MRMISRKIPVFLSVLASSLVFSALPAEAGRLLNWGYDTRQNQLEFTTDEGVQPRAQLVTNPSRLVIDLPGTKFGRKQLIQPIVNAPGVKSLRVGQFDPQTARLVIELEAGYTIDPLQVKFEGVSPRQWRITLPTPTQQGFVGDSTTGVDVPAPAGGTPPPVYTPPTSSRPFPALSRTQVTGFQVTGDGFFIRTTGEQPQIQVTKSFDRRQVYIDLVGSTLAPNASPRDTIVNQRGVSRAILSQSRPNPPTTRLTLNVSPGTPEWQASSTPDGSGVIVIPQLAGDPGTAPNPGQLNQVQAVEIEGDRQLVIRTTQRLTYTGNWDRATGGYRITLPFSQLAANVRGPRLTNTSPLLQVRLRQDDAQTVSVLVFPANNTQLGELNQPNPQSLTLQLRRSGFQPINPGSSIPVPRPFPGQIPRVPTNGRQIVVIDPGHGGPDPGAVGIAGIQEKEIVMDISNQIAGILQQQGIAVILTRTGDYDFDLAPRVQIAESNRAAVFVSIHANAISMSRPDVNGLETYYFNSGLDLARTIHSSILQGVNIRDRGVRSARFYVLRNTSMPSVLVETGFVTGAEDARNLADPNHRRQMAEAIARGILQYLRGGG
jgi:N-acetylmuramoyl-L-alanine amidase